jgi:hypothetical protein
MSGQGPPSLPALYAPAPPSPERFRRDDYYWIDFQWPRSKNPLFGRNQSIIVFIGRKPIYTIFGRKPIFKVEKIVDLITKVEKQYLLGKPGT